MAYSGRLIGTFALGLLTAATVQFMAPGQVEAGRASQVGAIKDAYLVMKVHSEFINEDVLNGSDIDVDAKDGMVTLQGTVPSEAARKRALELARKNDGVKGVTDELRVIPPAAATPNKSGDTTAGAGSKRSVDDGWIKSKIYAQFMADWNTVLDDSDIDVDVERGQVTLNGTVKSAEAKSRAVAIAKGTDGVKGVTDRLKVGTTR
jgi:hyperosmotically inducible protein